MANDAAKEVVPGQEKEVAPGQEREFDNKEVLDGDRDVEAASSFESSIKRGDVLGQEHTDPVLNAKMHLVNNVRMPMQQIVV